MTNNCWIAKTQCINDLGLMFFDFVHYFTNMNFCYYIIDDWNEMYTVYQPGLYM